MRYVLKSVKTDKFIALDRASGGYPREVDSVWDAKWWDDPTKAISYTAVMSWSDYNNPVFAIVGVDMVVGPEMPMPTGDDLEATR